MKYKTILSTILVTTLMGCATPKGHHGHRDVNARGHQQDRRESMSGPRHPRFNDSQWEGIRKRVEAMVESGEITKEQARRRIAEETMNRAFEISAQKRKTNR